MKPSLREDLTAISAIGAGAFASGVLTAVLLAGTSGHERSFEVEVGADPHVEVHWEAQILMAGPEGLHSGWFPPSEEPHLRRSSKAHVLLEAPHSRITIHRHP
jgi:hypothetical protein